MRLQIGILTLLSAAGVALAQPEIDVQVIQNGNSVTANWAGQPLTVTPDGSDTWDVSLSSGGHQLDGFEVGRQISWNAPNGGSTYEVVTETDTTDLEYQSDVASPEGIGPYGLGVSFYIGEDINGNRDYAYAQVFDTQNVPDGGTTASLLGLGLLGLGMLRSKLSLARRT